MVTRMGCGLLAVPPYMLNVLLAEDNPGDVFLVKLALDEHRISHELYVVNDGEQAIRFLGTMGKPGKPPFPDLLLLDINLPRAEGFQVLSEFRKRAECARTPVIVVTSSGALSDRIRMAALGVDGYFCKPPVLEEFLALGQVVRRIVFGSAAGSSATFAE
jgi:DNA-binding response OmpR family regulator